MVTHAHLRRRHSDRGRKATTLLQPDPLRVAVETRTHDPRGEAVSEKIVHIDGHEVLVSEQLLEIDQIRFDSANPRIQFQLDTALTDAPPTQEALGYALTVGNDQYERHATTSRGTVAFSIPSGSHRTVTVT